MNSANPSRAIVAEFHKSAGGRLTLFSFTVIKADAKYLTRAEYDIEWSHKFGYIYEQCGFGGCCDEIPVSGIYFVSGHVNVKEHPTQLVDARDKPPWRSAKTRVIRERNRTRRLRALPKSFVMEPGWDLLNWLCRHAINQDAVWCSTCRDWFPEDDVCDHVWWCDKKCWWSTPTERCKCKDRDECRA